MKRLYTSKRHPCPICSNHHGCAIRNDNLIECLRSFNQQDAPAGYRFLALLRNDMGGLFVKDDGSNHQQEKPLYSQQQRHSVKLKKRLSVKKCADMEWLIAQRHRQFQLRVHLSFVG
ncbi:MAG: hypothetical protein HC862_31295 [Scytonema sp. RU_4_4]|nr:hypothetical protein [Scytonema sp. RU_4_4]